MDEILNIDNLANGIEIPTFTNMTINDNYILGMKDKEIYVYDLESNNEISKILPGEKIKRIQLTTNYILIIVDKNWVFIYDRDSLSLKYKLDFKPMMRYYLESTTLIESDGRIYFNNEFLGVYDPSNDHFVAIKTKGMRNIEYKDLGSTMILISEKKISHISKQLFQTKSIFDEGNLKRLNSIDANDNVIVSGGTSGILHILHRYTNQEISTTDLHSEILSVKLHGSTLIAGLENGNLVIIDFSNLDKSLEIQKMKITQNIGLSSIEWTEKHLLVGDITGVLHVIDLSKPDKIRKFNHHSDTILDISHDQFHIYTSSADGKTVISDIETHTKVGQLKQEGPVLGVELTKENIYTIGSEKVLIKWKKSTFLEQKRSRILASEWLSGIQSDGKYIYVSGYDGNLRVFDLNCDLIALTQVYQGFIYDLALHVDKIFLTTDNGGIVQTSKVGLEPEVRELDLPIEYIRYKTLMGNYYYILDHEKYKILEVDIETQDHRVYATLDLSTSYVSGFSSGNGYLLVNSENESILLDIKSGEQHRFNTKNSELSIQDNYLINKGKDKTTIFSLIELNLQKVH